VSGEESPTVLTGSTRKVSAALIVSLVAVAALIVAFVAFDGPAMVADLLGGSTADTASTIPPKPSTTGVATDTADASDSASATASAESSATSSTSDADSASGVSASSVNVASGSSAASKITPPTGDQTSRMFWEQVGSQQQIAKLVSGEISSVGIGSVSKTASLATLGITVHYTNGSSLSGSMVLRNYSGTWYFSSIHATGNTATLVHTIPADTGVVSAIVSATSANQAIPVGMINGGYKTCTISHVSSGSGTATLGITLSGGSAARTSGKIVCISKTISSSRYWFITSFDKN